MRHALKCLEHQTQIHTMYKYIYLYTSLSPWPARRFSYWLLFWIKNKQIHANIRIYHSVPQYRFLQLVGFNSSRGLAWMTWRPLTIGQEKISSFFSWMVEKPRGYNRDAVRISFPSAPLSRTGRESASAWNCISSPWTETATKTAAEASTSTRKSRCCS